jgi:WD40 repeat protein
MLLFVLQLLFLPVFDEEFSLSAELYTPVSLRVDHQGLLYTTDTSADEGMVVVISPYGEELNRFGPKGEGPGEFQRAGDVAVFPNSRILVTDSQTGKVQLFESDGTFIKQVIKGEPAAQIHILPGDRFLIAQANGIHFGFIMSAGEDIRLFKVFDLDGKVVASFGDYTTHKNPLMSVFLNMGSLVIRDNTYTFASWTGNQISIFPADKGKPEIIKYRLPFVPNEFEEDMVESTNPDGTKNFMMSVAGDFSCTGFEILPDGRFLLLRATENTENNDMPRVQLVMLDKDGRELKAYPGKFIAKYLALSPDARYAYYLEEQEDWIITRVTLDN